MPIETIIRQLKQETENSRRAGLNLVIHSAPLLKRKKESCILAFRREELGQLMKELYGTGIRCKFLYHEERRCIVFLYREEMLNQYLAQAEVRQFLSEFGYEGSTIADYLPLLKRRVTFFYRNGETFPHEIGAFLGYPIRDVKGFIRNQGKNFLLCGHWKVYTDERGAREKFRLFDEAKQQAVEEWFAGKTLCEIAG